MTFFSRSKRWKSGKPSNNLCEIKYHMKNATFGAGCFWGVQDAFDSVEGVEETTVGYMGGTTENPSYEEVCTNRTGHAEVVHLLYDPEKVSYNDLLKVFWSIHDPTQKNRQGPDVGSQYRSVIFYHDEEQRAVAEVSKESLEQSKKYNREITTEISEAGPFYPAEKYHQHYFKKHGLSHCPI